MLTRMSVLGFSMFLAFLGKCIAGVADAHHGAYGGRLSERLDLHR